MSAVDEARLRELAEALRVSWGDRGWVAAKKISGLLAEAREAATGIDALLDALSAERERGDRAVGLLRTFGADTIEGVFDNDLVAEVREFLATQKADQHPRQSRFSGLGREGSRFNGES